jgi:hypothetical protein
MNCWWPLYQAARRKLNLLWERNRKKRLGTRKREENWRKQQRRHWKWRKCGVSAGRQRMKIVEWNHDFADSDLLFSKRVHFQFCETNENEASEPFKSHLTSKQIFGETQTSQSEKSRVDSRIDSTRKTRVDWSEVVGEIWKSVKRVNYS